jgi:hypothetical protein
MTNYRIYKIETFASSSVTGSVASTAWGVMKDHDGTLGGIVMEGGGTLVGSHMITGQIYPCYPRQISCVTGSFSIFS